MQAESLIPGVVIAGRYVVERTLGRGGMGAVYVVSHVHTGKRLALKALLPEFVHNADLVGRFLREAQVMGRLQHRHVVDVFDVGRDGDVLYIVMELLEGKPLSDLLHDATLTLEEALLVLTRAMEGVSAAHDHGVVHRDLKPDNIFVCVGASGRLDDPRVLDFGISKLEDAAAQPLTRSGVAMGTPYYMSIEQLSGQRDLDARVDVYALGVILYEAISGEPPYAADSISALAIRVLTTHAVHLGQLRPDLPPGLADVVMKAISRNRDDRHRSVRALIEALRPFIPRSAGLSVPEGQGRLLRTPRSGGALRPASLHSGVQTSSQTYGSMVLATQSDGVARSTVQTAPSSWRKPALLSLAIIVLAGGVALLSRQSVEPSRDSALPTATSLEPARAPSTSPSLAVQPHVSPPMEANEPNGSATRRSQSGDAGSVARAPSTLPSSSPSGTGAGVVGDARGSLAPLPNVKDRSGTRRQPRPRAGEPTDAPPRMEASKVEEPRPAPQSEPAPAPVPASATRKSAEGRAGKLGSDEF